MLVHLTPKSANAKTGPIPVSTSGRQTCPDSCTLRNNGCYADSGPLRIHWNKITEGQRGTDWDTFCATIAAMPDNQLWRHNQAGDMPCIGALIDHDKTYALVNANKGKRGFTYTHHTMALESNRHIVAYANRQGFTINLSAESLEHADTLAELKIAPVVTIIPEGMEKTFHTPAGNKVVTCPATYRDDISCATCQLCQRQRDIIIAFPVHGTSKKKAHKVFMLASV